MEVYGRNLPLTSETVVLINAWEPHSYVGSRGGPAFLLAFFLDPAWLSDLALAASRVALRAALRAADTRVEAADRSLRRSYAARLRGRTANPRTAGRGDHDVGPRVSASTTALRAPPISASAAPSSYIHENPGHHFDTAELAAISGLSIPHFFERFKECTGVTPRIYVKVVKIEHAFNVADVRGMPHRQGVRQPRFQGAEPFHPLLPRADRHHAEPLPAGDRRSWNSGECDVQSIRSGQSRYEYAPSLDSLAHLDRGMRPERRRGVHDLDSYDWNPLGVKVT